MSDSAVDVEHRRIRQSSAAATKRDRIYLRNRVGVVILVPVDGVRLDCSDENEVLPSLVSDIGKPADLRHPFAVLPSPLNQ